MPSHCVAGDDVIPFTPYLSSPTATVSDAFLSFNFDWHTAAEGKVWANSSVLAIDLASPRLRALTSALAKATEHPSSNVRLSRPRKCRSASRQLGYG